MNIRKLKRGSCFLFFLSISLVYAESSGELIRSLYSPLFLGGGTSVIRMDTPQAVSLNPAAAGNFQRTILDANYESLLELENGIQGMGHAANVGVSYPGKYGVFTGALHFASTNQLDDTAVNFGTFGALDVAFSKELYKNVYAGFGLNGALGTDLEWGAGLNLGFIHNLGTFGKLKNFKWGVSLINMGRGYGTGQDGYMQAVSENFTLNGAAGFDFLQKNGFVWSMNGNISFPTMTDLRLEIGQDFRIQDIIRISLSSSMDLMDTIAGNYQTLIPSAGIYYNYKFKNKGAEKTEKQTSEIEIQTAAGPLYDGILAIGAGVTIPFGVRDTNPPVVTMNPVQDQYISPDLNGIQDELVTPFTVNDERYVMGYRMTVRNESGDVVKEFLNKDDRPENESFKNIFDRMFSEKKGTTIPDSFRWDGLWIPEKGLLTGNIPIPWSSGMITITGLYQSL